MGSVISFEKEKRKKKTFNPNKEKSKMAAEKATCESNRIDVDYTEMEPEQQAEFWKNMEKEEEEKFRCKYNDVLAAVPISADEKMQYFAKNMLQLIPDIFHENNWDARFDVCVDFCWFYITGFDPAYSDYIKENKEFKQEYQYQYKFKEMAAEKLEEDLLDCLRKIIEMHPEKQGAKAAFMFQAARLFELEEILSDLFYKELMNE